MSASVFVRPPWVTPLSVSSVLVDGPTEEPLTLEQGKLRAGLDWQSPDPRDAMMLGFIAAARQYVERRTGLALLTQTRDVTIAAGWPVLPLPMHALPVQSITTPAGVRIDRVRVRYALGSWDVDVPDVSIGGTWRIVSGWPTVEALTAEAPLLVHAVGLLVAHYATFGRDVAIAGVVAPVPFSVDEALSSYEIVTVA
jgi:uncharacterized phiE125 gp8 family phage protein